MSDPDPGPVELALLETEFLLELGRAEEARGVALAALATAPGEPRLLTVVARSLVGYDSARAIDVVEQAIVADPELEPAHRVRALALLDARRPKEAVHSALASVRLAPERAEPLAVLARALAESGDVRGAVAAAGRAVHVEPGAPSGWFAQGLIALRGQQWTVAEQNFRKALELRPDHADARDALDVALRGLGVPVSGPTSIAGPGPGWRSGVRSLLVALLVANVAAWIGGPVGMGILVVGVVGAVAWWRRRPPPVAGPGVEGGRGWQALPPELRGSLLAGTAVVAFLFLLAALGRVL